MDMMEIKVTDARACLPDLIARVTQGEEVTLTRHGRAVAVLVRPDSLRGRRTSEATQRAQALHEQLSQAAGTAAPALEPARADELVAAIDRDRSG